MIRTCKLRNVDPKVEGSSPSGHPNITHKVSVRLCLSVPVADINRLPIGSRGRRVP